MKPEIILRIGLVDDNVFYNKLLTGQLKEYATRLADATDALIQVQGFTVWQEFLINLHTPYDLIFLDYYLGNGVKGEDLLPEIRRENSKCRIMMLSGVHSEQIPFRSLLLGADGFVPKNKNTFQVLSLIMENQLTEKIRLCL